MQTEEKLWDTFQMPMQQCSMQTSLQQSTRLRADERPSRFKKQGLLIVNGCSVQ
jgi:23S rRNA A2030 N6-methylase RlmJ